MRQTEVAALLVYANGLDQRQGTDDVKVQVWFDFFQTECPDIDPAWAKGVIAHHYGQSSDMLTPAHLTTAWRKVRSARREREAVESHRTEAACPFPGCRCAHIDGCYKGWIDGDGTGPTSPCPICRPSLAEVLDRVGSGAHRTPAESAMIRNRFQEAQ